MVKRSGVRAAAAGRRHRRGVHLWHPVASLSYAQVLAKVVKHEKLPPVPYDYRLFI